MAGEEVDPEEDLRERLAQPVAIVGDGGEGIPQPTLEPPEQGTEQVPVRLLDGGGE